MPITTIVTKKNNVIVLIILWLFSYILHNKSKTSNNKYLDDKDKYNNLKKHFLKLKLKTYNFQHFYPFKNKKKIMEFTSIFCIFSSSTVLQLILFWYNVNQLDLQTVYGSLYI